MAPTFDAFMAEWRGKRVDFDHVFPWQCVDLVQQYVYELDGIRGLSGNAINYWTDPTPALLSKFYKVDSTEPEKGDIVVLRSHGTNPGDFSGEGHIGVATGAGNATQFELFEQNGGGTDTGLPRNGAHWDEIGTRWIERSRIAGLLRRIPVAVAAQPEIVSPYTIESIPRKEIVLVRDTHEWGMHYDNFTAIANNPVRDVAAGTPLWVTAICHHNIGEDYYLEDQSVQYGYNVKDCADVPVVAPLPPAPIPTNPANTGGATLFPGIKETYTLVVEVPGYSTSNSAANHLNPTIPAIPTGDYFVFAKRLQNPDDPTSKVIAYNITHNYGTSFAWINPDDNKLPEPEPEPIPEPSVWIGPRDSNITPAPAEPAAIPWRMSIDWFHSDRTPDWYVPQDVFAVKNWDGNTDDLPVPAGHKVAVYGTFPNPSGIKCYLLRVGADIDVHDPVYGNVTIKKDTDWSYRYGVPVTDENGKALLVKYVVPAPVPVPIADTVTVSQQVNTIQHKLYVMDKVNQAFAKAGKCMDILIVKIKEAVVDMKGIK